MLDYHLKIERMKKAPKIAFVKTIAISTRDQKFVNEEVHKHQLWIPEAHLRNATHRLINNKTGKEWTYYMDGDPMFADGKFVTYLFYDSNHEMGHVTIGYIPTPDYEIKANDIITDHIDPNIL